MNTYLIFVGESRTLTSETIREYNFKVARATAARIYEDTKMNVAVEFNGKIVYALPEDSITENESQELRDNRLAPGRCQNCGHHEVNHLHMVISNAGISPTYCVVCECDKFVPQTRED